MTEKSEIKSCFRFLILSQSFKSKKSPSFDKVFFVKLRVKNMRSTDARQLSVLPTLIFSNSKIQWFKVQKSLKTLKLSMPTYSKVGHNLRRLDLHYNHQSPGIDLITVGKCCPNLTEFSVCDSLVSAPNLMMVHASNRLFSHLFSLKLLRVSYSHQDDWEAIPRQVTFLLKMHSRAEGILNKSEKNKNQYQSIMNSWRPSLT